MVQNYMELMVDNALKNELLAHTDRYAGLCTCPVCLAAIKAIALNQLPPFYITCVAGAVYGEYRSKEMQNLSDVLVAIGKGIENMEQNGPYCKRTAAV